MTGGFFFKNRYAKKLKPLKKLLDQQSRGLF
jgi:hypothetical protein